MISDLLGNDLVGVISAVGEIVLDPASNPRAGALLLAMASIVLTMIILGIILAIIRGDKSSVQQRMASRPVAQPAMPPVSCEDDSRPGKTRRRSALPTALLAVGLIGIVWITAGYVTGRPEMCLSCHTTTVHAPSGESSENDPHAETSCVSCHERGGLAGSLTYNVPIRALHFVGGFSETVNEATSYGGSVSSASCSRCHDADVAETVTVEDRGVRVSHIEPLQAGAACLDCHKPIEGVISGITVGMSTCLPCHDGATASADCESCHAGDVSQAVRASVMDQFSEPRELIEQPTCGGCHDQASCDSCHGVRLPHTREFMLTGHARAGVEDIWFNDGQTCGKCHNEERRPCTKCHQKMPSHGVSWSLYHRGNPEGCSCHARNAYMYGRNICELCHEPGIDK